MAKIATRDLNKKISLCSAKDVITDTGEMHLIREDVVKVWAKIDPKVASMYSREGFNIMESRNRQTHLITIRARKDIDISSSAWVYQHLAGNDARWYKVLGIRDYDGEMDFLVISARLVQKGEDLTPPVDEGATACAPLRRVDHGVEI
jgi:head-tail adaptor